ncbi:hypothetical protein LX36DRAFT_243000 [Colletotrichum falcatum]|nr:hypothetical protein LX36DRAFT_243000 [Colletotrichum falcatum]
MQYKRGGGACLLPSTSAILCCRRSEVRTIVHTAVARPAIAILKDALHDASIRASLRTLTARSNSRTSFAWQLLLFRPLKRSYRDVHRRRRRRPCFYLIALSHVLPRRQSRIPSTLSNSRKSQLPTPTDTC